MSQEIQFEIRELFSDEEDNTNNEYDFQQFDFEEQELNNKVEIIQPKRKYDFTNIHDIFSLVHKCNKAFIYPFSTEAEHCYNLVYRNLRNDLVWLHNILIMLQDHKTEEELDVEFACNSNFNNEVRTKIARIQYHIAYLKRVFNIDFLN